jgi:hypothetical protein
MYIRGPRTFEFKDPWKDTSLTDAEREYLKYALLIINKNRANRPISDEALLAGKYQDSKFFQVPLKQGTTRNRADVNTFWDLLKTKIRSLTPEFLYNQQIKEN